MASIEDKLQSQLHRSQKIIAGGHELVPTFRVFVHDGDYIVLNPLPDDLAVRQARMDLVRRFMVWKMATGFILSSETLTPDALICIAVWRNRYAEIQVKALYCRIERLAPKRPGQKLTFSPTEHGGKECAGDVLAMLPAQEERLSQQQITELEQLMGEAGRFGVKKL